MPGFKTWAVGEEVLAADFNGYVQQQTIAIFPNAAARDAAIIAPISGQTCFLTDAQALYTWNGSAWITHGRGRIASAVTTGRDATQGLTVAVQVSFTLAVARLIRIEGYIQYSQITAASNASTYGNVGYDLGRQTLGALMMNLPLSASAGGYLAVTASLAAGAHTAEVHAVNNSTVGAMRIAATTGAWVNVVDVGGA